jgi:mono/diheme cytochrome c family protein
MSQFAFRFLPSSLVLAGLLAAAPALAVDLAHGERVAKRWCAECHVVASDQARAKADAPSFADIASRKTSREVSAFLTDPHPRMPDMSLSRDEIADIVSYLKSQATGPDEPARPVIVPDDPKLPKRG